MDAPLAGKTAVVTGATGGIGLATARGLAALGARVALVGRDLDRGERALEAVQAEAPDSRPLLFLADLARLADVRHLAVDLREGLPRIDVLVNNAGAIHMVRKTSADGFEMTFAVNHLAPYLLTRLLASRLQESAPARVVTVSSEAHRRSAVDFDDLQSERAYHPWRAYGASKLMNVLFSNALAMRLPASAVTSNSLHPGVVASGFGKNDPGWMRLLVTFGGPFLLSPRRGARTSIHVASAPDLAGVTGRYFAGRREATPAPAALDEAAQDRLWEVSARLVGLDP